MINVRYMICTIYINILSLQIYVDKKSMALTNKQRHTLVLQTAAEANPPGDSELPGLLAQERLHADQPHPLPCLVSLSFHRSLKGENEVPTPKLDKPQVYFSDPTYSYSIRKMIGVVGSYWLLQQHSITSSETGNLVPP